MTDTDNRELKPSATTRRQVAYATRFRLPDEPEKEPETPSELQAAWAQHVDEADVSERSASARQVGAAKRATR